MKRIFTRLSFGLLLMLAGSVASAQSFWTDVAESQLHVEQSQRKIVPAKYRTLALDTLSILNFMKQAPQEFTAAAKNNPLVLELPMPDGSTATFKIMKYDMMQPGLAAQFPYFRSFSGQGVDDPYATLKIDWNALGFHAQILSATRGAVYIDPYVVGNLQYYISYNKSDLAPKPFTENGAPLNLENKVRTAARTQSGTCVAGTIRKYRLAVACTGEYARAATGNTNPSVAQVLSAIQTTVNRVNGVYETEVAIRLVLIDSTTKLIFRTPGVGFTTTANNNANILIDSSQNKITRLIGSANFDIGHTVSTGGGGLAGLGVVCQDAQKAAGITGSPSPTGDPYDIDYVAHEMGHQFGGEHTFNATTGSCSGNGSNTANAEPGSGVTIMAYAGICLASNDLASNSIPYFHPISFDELTQYSNFDAGNTCPVTIATGNNAPNVSAGVNYIIPKSTPFFLTGSGSDPDGDAITYSWEQVNVGGPFSNWNAPTGNAPIFRSFPPTTSPIRFFPKLSDVINNTTTIGELLPSYARVLKFRLTGRDNKAGNGGVCYSEMNVTVAGTAGPLQVTQPNTAVSWTAGTYKTVTWNVANTNITPVNCTNVMVELSTDGGNTFPTVLLASTPNDGSEDVLVPNSLTTTARIRVRAVGNVFYDMSNTNFSIVAPTSADFVFNTPSPVNSCISGTPQGAVLNSNSLLGFSTPITLSASGNPAGSSVVFGTNPLTPGSSTTVSLTGVATPGAYTVTVTGTAGAVAKNTTIVINVQTAAAVPTGMTPVANAIGVSTTPTLKWNGVTGANGYTLMVADNAAFAAPLVSTNLTDTFYTFTTPLLEATEYYWKLTANNSCGAGITSANFLFKTEQIVCGSTLNSTNVPVNIAASGTPTINSTLAVTTSGTIKSLSVMGIQGTHTYVSDLTFSLVNPLGVPLVLADNLCGNLQDFSFSFDDKAAAAYTDIPCPPTDGLTYRPLNPLSTFAGQNTSGTWRLRIKDNYNGDGGALNAWGISFCTTTSVALPVSWLSFTGRKNEDNSVVLNWKTASEENNDHYQIERSSNGREFSQIGKMSAGAGSGGHDYYFTDNKPFNGENYYRLKQVDKDGKFSYSKVVRVNTGKNGVSYVVYPNPTTDKVTVRMLASMKNVSLRLMDAAGKTVFAKATSAVVEGQEIIVPVKGLGKGVYVLQIASENGLYNEKVVVQ